MSQYRINSKKALAFGCEASGTLNSPDSYFYVRVWDISEKDDPCDGGAGDFNNILAYEQDISEQRIVEVAHEHGFSLIVPRSPVL